MHEYALAEAVLRTALGIATERHLARITALHVAVGELQQISLDLFQGALANVPAAQDPRLADLHSTVTIEPATLRCRACGAAFSMRDAAGRRGADDLEAIHFVPELAHAFLGCPACASPDFEILGGRGVTIAGMEGEEATTDPRTEGARDRLAGVQRIIAVTGGKGGIGKSSVAAVLALEAAAAGHRTGLLDLDFTSPSTHVLLGYPTSFPEEPFGIEPATHAGIRCMSMAHFAGAHAAPLRGADVSGALLELLAITRWGELDLLVVDMPPGLGDATLDVLTLLDRAEHLVVTTSSRVVVDSVDRMLQLLTRTQARVLGVLENMARAPSSIAATLSERRNVRHVGTLPFDESLEHATGDCARITQTAFASAVRACLGALDL